MVEANFPGQHTTTTTVTNTAVSPDIRFDPLYVRTTSGIFKAACVILNFIGFICIQVTVFRHTSEGEYFTTVAVFGFWYSLIMLALYTFHFCEKFYLVPWLKIEFGFNVLLAVLYVFAASFAATIRVEAFGAAAFFGFVAMCLYAIDAFFKFQAVRAGEIAQGSRTVRQQTTTISA